MIIPDARLPSPDVYESEYTYWPWGNLIKQVASIVVSRAHPGSLVIDYMCGTGYLLDLIASDRGDISVMGYDISGDFVTYSSNRRPNANVILADATTVEPDRSPTFILCTAGVHHLPFEKQGEFLAKIAREAVSGSTIIIGEIAIPDYVSEEDRRLSALRFNYSIVEYGISDGWPPEMIEVAIDITRNDVLLLGEYKRSLLNWRRLFCEHMVIHEEIPTWVSPVGGGDYIFVCKPKLG